MGAVTVTLRRSGGAKTLIAVWSLPPTRPLAAGMSLADRNLLNEIGAAVKLLLRFLGFLFAAGTVVFLVGVAATPGLIWHFSKDLPDYLSASGLRAAGDDARSRGRRRAARRIFQGAASLPADPGGAEARHQRVPRRRGQEFLRTRRHRLFRAWHARPFSTRRTMVSNRRPQGASTITQQVAKNFLSDQRGFLHPQDQGSAVGDADRAHLFEGQDPRTLSQ